MGREVRRVPHDWQHHENRPLLDGFTKAVNNWDKHSAQWLSGYREDYEGWAPGQPTKWRHRDGTEMCATYAEWAGTRPDPTDYMPVWSPNEATHYQMYETTTEGTPISPVCATPEDLARWLTDNGASAFGDTTADYDSWLRVCRGGYAPSVYVTRTAAAP